MYVVFLSGTNVHEFPIYKIGEIDYDVFSGLFSVVNVILVINLSWFYTLFHIIKSQN